MPEPDTMNCQPANMPSFVRRLFNRPDLLLCLLAGVVSIVLAILSLLRHWHFASTEDLAMQEQALWNIRHGNGAWLTLSGNSWLQFPHHFFGEHFSPILYLLAWPAGLTAGPEALLILQALMVALAAIPAAKIVALETGRRAWGLIAGLLWLALPGIWGATLYDFHMEACGPILLFAFWLSFRQKHRICWLWAFLYIITKKDAPIYLMFLALAGSFLPGYRRQGLRLAGTALVYALLVLLVAQPLFSPTSKHLLSSRLAWPQTWDAVLPWLQTQFFEPARWQSLSRHLLPFGLLPLLAGWTSLPWLGALGIQWLSTDWRQAHCLIHYPLIFYPLLFIAAAVGWGWLNRHLQLRSRHIRLSVFIFILGLSLAGLGWGWFSEQSALIHAYGHANKAACQRASQLLADIPADAEIRAALTLTPHLARRDKVGILMKPDTTAEWIATRLDKVVHPCRDHEEWLKHNLLSEKSDYGVWDYEKDFLVICKRGHPRSLNQSVRAQIKETVQAEHLSRHTGRVISSFSTVNGYAMHFKPSDQNGAAAFGNYRHLPAGKYRVDFRVRAKPKKAQPFALLEVVENFGSNIVLSIPIAQSIPIYTNITCEVEMTGSGGAEFRIMKIGRGWLWADQISWQHLED